MPSFRRAGYHTAEGGFTERILKDWLMTKGPAFVR
jgi:hypothetical protein